MDTWHLDLKQRQGSWHEKQVSMKQRQGIMASNNNNKSNSIFKRCSCHYPLPYCTYPCCFYSCSTGFSLYAPCKCWSVWAPPFMLIMVTQNHTCIIIRKLLNATCSGKFLWRPTAHGNTMKVYKCTNCVLDHLNWRKRRRRRWKNKGFSNFIHVIVAVCGNTHRQFYIKWLLSSQHSMLMGTLVPSLHRESNNSLI